ncbi:Ig-like domain-containing protein [Maridesulfovibrio sp.]|uniref:Ig-like domain-containing protein n=1 Tax=Maridesulfovibrio sp. TaxID=2795000 RepID=UPI002A18E754|nr:Ig-like domain-containing protein [Maridesulfovibrio sp.]
MAEDTNDSQQNRVPPSTVYKVEGSPDDYRYVLRGADLVLVDKDNHEQVFMFVGNIMSLDGKVDMEFSDGESLESKELFDRSEMQDSEKEEESSTWEVQDSPPAPASTTGNSFDGDGLNPSGSSKPELGISSLTSASAQLSVDSSRAIISTQTALIKSSSSSATSEETFSSTVKPSSAQKQETTDNPDSEEKQEDTTEDIPEEETQEETPEETSDSDNASDEDSPDPDTVSRPTIHLAEGEDNGYSDDDGIISSQNPTFEGETDGGATVKIYVNDELKDTIVADENGDYSVTIAGLNDGDYEIYAVASIGETVSEDSVVLSVEVDATAPGVPTMQLTSQSDTKVGTIAGIYTNDSTLSLEGTGGDPDSRVTISYSTDGVNYTELATVSVGSDGSWGYTLTEEQALTDGEYTFKLTAEDLAGNVSSGATYLSGVTLKTTDPSSTGLDLVAGSDSYDEDAGGTNSDNLTNKETIDLTVVGASDDTAKVSIYLIEDGTYTYVGDAAKDSSGNWVYTVAEGVISDDGTYRFVAELTDYAGNVEGRNIHASLDVVIDRTPPEVEPTIDLDSGSDSTTSSPDLGGTDEDDITSSNTVTLKGTAEVGAPINIYLTVGDGTEKQISDGEITTDGLGNWTYTYDVSSYGTSGSEELTFRAEVCDAADNAADETLTVTVDHTDPDRPTIGLPSSGEDQLLGTLDTNLDKDIATVRNDSAVLTGKITESSSEVVLVLYQVDSDGNRTVIANSLADNGALGDVSITDNGDGTYSWSYDYGNLTDGETYTFVATVEDLAGNTSLDSKTFEIRSDQTIDAPTIDLAPGFDSAGGPAGTESDDYTAYPDGDSSKEISFKISGDTDSTISVYLLDSSADGAVEIVSGEVSVGSGILVDSVVDDSGDWPLVSFDASAYAGTTTELTFVAVSTDMAGNSKYTTYTMTLDDSDPVAGAIDLDASDDLGTYADDEITNAREILISGTLEEGANAVKVTVYDNGVEIGEATVSGNETDGYKWEFSIGDEGSTDASDYITEGSHSYTAVVEDNAGNQTVLDALPVTIDRSISDPTFVLTSGEDSSDTGRITNDGITKATELVFEGSSDIGDTVTVHVVDSEGHDTIVGSFVASAADWEYTVANSFISADGDYEFYAVTSDVAGNSKTTASVDVTIDRTTNTPGDIDLTTGSDTSYTDGSFSVGTDSDNITSSENLTFTGAVESSGVEKGSTVYLYVVGTDDPVGSVVVGEDDTSWTITVARDDVGQGTHEFYVRYVDLAGTESASSSILPVEVDSIKPSTPTITLDDAAEYPVHDGTVYTNKVNPEFTISNLEEGTSLNIKINGVSVKTVVVDASGSYSFDPEDFASDKSDDGTKTITVVAVDEAGNVSDEATYSFELDTFAENISGVKLADTSNSGSLDDNITSETEPHIVGYAEAYSSVVVTILNGENVASTGTVVAGADGSWDYPVTESELGEGVYTVEVTATDYAGNVATDTSYSFTVDTSIDPVGFDMIQDVDNDTGFELDDHNTQTRNPGFSWTAGENLTATISIYDSEGNLIKSYYNVDSPSGDNSWAVPVADSLEDGTYTFKAVFTDTAGNTVITDASGNEVSEEVVVVIDNESPALTVELADDSDSGTDNDWLTNDEKVAEGLVLSGTAEAGVHLFVYVNDMEVSVTNDATGTDGYITVGENGEWTFDLSGLDIDSGINDGDNTIKVEAVDQAGNVTTFTQILEVDSEVSPAGVILLADESDSGYKGDFTTNDMTPTLTGTTEANATLVVSVMVGDESKAVGTVTADDDGNWSVTVPDGILDEDGDYVFTAVITDAADNEATITQSIRIDTDPMVPTISMDEDTKGEFFGTDSDYVTSDTSPVFTVTTEAHTSLDVYVDGVLQADLSVAIGDNTGDGILTVSLSGLAEGTYTYRFVSTDSAGNTSETTQVVTIDPEYSADDLTISIDSDYDSGVSDSDGLTYETRPLLTGTAEAGSKLRIYISERYSTGEEAAAAALGDSYVTELVLADDDSTWEYTPTDLGEDGYYKVTVVSEDEAGNRQVKYIIIDLDTTPPQTPTFVLSDGGVDNTIETTTRTTDNTPFFEGEAEANSTLTISISEIGVEGDVLFFTTTTDADGKWSYQVEPGDALNDGSYNVSITSTDEAGNEAEGSAQFQITGETPVPPTINLSSADDSNIGTDAVTNHNSGLTLTGIAESYCNVKIYKTTEGDTDRTGGELLDTVEAGANGVWTYELDGTLADGSYYYYATSVYSDDAGYTSDELLTLVVDTQTITPTLELVEDTGVDNDWIAEDSNNTATDWTTSAPTITGVVDEGATVVITATDIYNNVTTITIAPENLTKDGDTWSYTYTLSELSDGEYAIQVTTTDLAGNEASSSEETLVIDTGFSKPTIDLPDAYDTAVSVNADGAILQADGTVAGNALRSHLPADFISTIVDGYTSENSFPLSGTADTGSLVQIEIYKDGELITTTDVFTVTNADGTWTYDTGTLSDGLYTFQVTCTDTAGNELQADSLSVYVDANATRTAEIVLNDDYEGNYTPDTTPTFTLYGDSDSVWLLYIDGESDPVATGTFNSSSTATYTPTFTTDGEHTYTLVTVDRAGNVQVADDLVFTIDTDAPDFQSDPSITSGTKGTGETYYTNSNTADITIQVEPGTAARILNIDGYNVDGSDTDFETGWVYDTDGDGYVTFSLDSGVYKFDGEYSDITIQYRDQAHNYDATQDYTFDMVVDTVKPVTDIALDSGSDHGFSDSDNLTSGDLITLSGTIQELGAGQEDGDFSTDIADYHVTLTNTDTGVSQTFGSDHITLHDDGTWEVTFGSAGHDLASGDYTATVTATDLAGNSHTSTTDFVIDNDSAGLLDHSPELSTQSLGSSGVFITGDYFGDDVSFSSSDYKCEVVYYTDDGASSSESYVDIDSDGSFGKYVSSSTIGNYDYVGITIIDSAGNESETTYIDFDGNSVTPDTVSASSEDSSDPSYTFTDSDSDADVATINVTLTGDYDNDGTTDVTIEGTASVSADNTWTMDFLSELQDGHYTLQLEGLDSSGDVITAQSESTYDFTLLDGVLDSGGDGGGTDSGTESADSGSDSDGDSGGDSGGSDAITTDDVHLEVTVHTDHIDGIA